MGIKSALKQVADYNGISTVGSAIGQTIFVGILSGMAGMLAGGVSTLTLHDGADQGESVGEAQVQSYRQKFAAIAETESTLLKLKKFSDASEMDALLGDNQSAAKQKYDRAKALITETQQKLNTDVFNLSQQMVVDKNIPEGRFDRLAYDFDNVVNTYALPNFLKKGMDEVGPFDSVLRECQIKLTGADGKLSPDKAEAVTQCTDDKTDDIVFKYGAGGGVGLAFAWFYALGPLLAARRRRAEEQPEEKPQDDTVTMKLKITYTAPKGP